MEKYFQDQSRYMKVILDDSDEYITNLLNNVMIDVNEMEEMYVYHALENILESIESYEIDDINDWLVNSKYNGNEHIIVARMNNREIGIFYIIMKMAFLEKDPEVIIFLTTKEDIFQLLIHADEKMKNEMKMEIFENILNIKNYEYHPDTFINYFKSLYEYSKRYKNFINEYISYNRTLRGYMNILMDTKIL